MVWEMSRTGFWKLSLKIGTSSSMTTRFPCRRVLVMLIVIGLAGTAARPAGMAAGPTEAIEHGLAAGAAVGFGFHSRIDLAGGGAAGFAAGAAAGVGFHSRIDLAGGGAPTGSAATTVSSVVAISKAITRHASIPVLNIFRPSRRSLRNMGASRTVPSVEFGPPNSDPLSRGGRGGEIRKSRSAGSMGRFCLSTEAGVMENDGAVLRSGVVLLVASTTPRAKVLYPR